MLEQRIQQQFFESADLTVQLAEPLARALADAAHALAACVTAGGKVMFFGSGSSSADAQRGSALFLGGFERERPGLPALALGTNSVVGATLAQARGLAAPWEAAIQALGGPGDVLVVLHAGGDTAAALAVVRAARAKDMTVVALTGRDGSGLRTELGETDVLVAVASDRIARIQEIHLLALHCLIDAVDLQLLGESEPA